MRYDFAWNIAVRDERLPEFDGWALVRPNQDGHGGWMVEGIYLDVGMKKSVLLPPDHFLYVPLHNWLHNEQRRAIDEAWGHHVAEQRAAREPV